MLFLHFDLLKNAKLNINKKFKNIRSVRMNDKIKFYLLDIIFDHFSNN